MDRFKVRKHVELTVKEYAERERVTPRTVYRWIDKGAIDSRKTPGGEIRIRLASVVVFDATTTDNS